MNKQHHESYYDIRHMLCYIFGYAEGRKTRLVPLSTIERAFPDFSNNVFSYCQWCMAAGVLHAHGDSFYLDSRFNGMTFAEFSEAINNIYIYNVPSSASFNHRSPRINTEKSFAKHKKSEA